MTQQLTEYSYHEMQARLAATASNERLAALGAKGGTSPTTLRLLQLLGYLRESRRMLTLPAHVTMNVWLFSNSGTGADCDLIEIPNRALAFLWEAARQYRTDVETLLRHESKHPEYQLLECIRRQRDYNPLYPAKNKPLTSKGLFALYQTQILGVSPQALQVAEKVASWLRQHLLQQAERERTPVPTRGKGRTRQTPAEKFLQQLTGRHP
jgi:hypothetical protein